MEIRKVEIGRIVPYAGNAKEHPREQIEQIKKSIEEFGNNDPIAVDGNMVVIEGHGRLIALKELGYREAEVIVLEGLTEEQKNAYRLVHNQLTMNTGFDLRALEAELERIQGIDMEALGFDLGELAEEFSKLDDTGEARDDGFDPEAALDEIEEPTTKPGDVWILGSHRLICGDSTKPETAEILLRSFGPGSHADMAVTDPPYNVAYEGSTKHRLTIENDDMDSASFEAFLTDAFSCMKEVLKPGGSFYVWHAASTQNEFTKALLANGLEVRQQLIWVKSQLVIGRQDYQWKHEPCFYGWKEGAGHYFADSRIETTVFDDEPDLNRMGKDELKAYCQELLRRGPSTTVIRENKPLRNEDHPTMKPIPLFGSLIKNSSRKGEIVLDPFCGSGTTVVACEQLGRKAAAAELDPKYCDVIVRRWEALTGKNATRLS